MPVVESTEYRRDLVNVPVYAVETWTALLRYLDAAKPPERIRRRAACVGEDTRLFFPGHGQNAAAARAVCRSCPVLVECGEWSLDRPELEGVWAGLTAKERRLLGQP